MPLTRRRASALLLLILAVGSLFRLRALRWDEGYHLHPDERFISMVEEKLSFPRLSEYFDSSRSSLNPYNRGNTSFVYGTVPVVAAMVVGKVVGKTGYDGTYLVGRALSGLFDLVTVWIVYLLTRRVAPRAGRGAALVAAGLLAFCPLAIQLSHFWTVDTFLTTFTSLALLGAVRLVRGRSGLRGDAATGVAIGLAIACKVTGLVLFAPLGIALLIHALRPEAVEPGRTLVGRMMRASGRFLLAAAAVAVTVRVFLPYAFLGPSPFSFRLDPRYLEDLKRLVTLSGSVAGYPPALQWAGRTALFPLYNFLFWAAGPFFGVAALVGLLWSLVAIARRKEWILAPLFAHAALLIAYHASALGKTLRYFYPVYPGLAVLAAVALVGLAGSVAADRPRLRVARFAGGAVLLGTFLCGVAFSSIYARPHTRVEASRWIHANVVPPGRFGNETWDDGLPFSLPGYDNTPFVGPMLELWGPDNAEKVKLIVTSLEKADWIAVTSNRVYANITRLPTVFPMTTAYYRGLFEGRLGFERAAEFTSYPSLGPLRIPDDRSEEQFTVYDHPRVLLFRKAKGFSAERVSRILLAAMPTTPPTIWDWEKMPRAERTVGTSLLPPRRTEIENAASGAAPSLEVGSLTAAALWYVALLVLGALALPAVHALFPRLEDRGAGFARVFSLAVSTYLLNLLVRLRVLPNGRGAAVVSALLLAAVSAAVFWRRRNATLRFLRERWRLLLAGEIAFAVGFLLFLGIRAVNPEIYWGEKPMDFSVLNILVRTRTFPASDPWFAGAPLSYYVFGHQIVAFLTLLTGLSTRFTFNLAFGLLGGVTLQGAFSLARNWAGTFRAGVAGAVLTALAGNLSGVREWLVNKRHLDWDYFWATSRVIPNTINEYPFWSLTFADLHAHVIAMPLLLLFFACALQFVRTHAEAGGPPFERPLHAALLGYCAALVALTNAWDVPLLIGLLLLVTLVAARSGGSPLRSAGRAALSCAVAAGAALAAAAPFWVRAGGMPGIGRNLDAARGIDILLSFGLFFFLAFAAGLSFVNARLSWTGFGGLSRAIFLSGSAVLLLVLGVFSIDALLAGGVLFFLFAAAALAQDAEERLAFGLVAASFFLVLFADRFYIYDRMNTFFKLYFEAWLLLAVSTAALVFGRRQSPGAFQRWSPAVRATALLLAVLAVFTSASGALGSFGHHFTAYSGPSLDGLRYLEETRRGEYQAVRWLGRNVSGTPVLLEAQGPSYQDFGRISMLTGLPTVLGWDYHVKQRGNPDREIEIRKKLIEQIYTSPTAAAAEGPLRRYHVGYIYVGWLERKTYPAEGLKKFDTEKGLFALAYENRESRIYRIVGGETEDVVVVTREILPAAPAAGKPEPVGEEPEEPPAIAKAAAADRPPYAGMKEPRDAAVDSRGRLWVSDFGNNRLRVFDRDGGFLGGWGGRGNGTFGLREPCAVAILGEELCVADTWNGRIESFTLAGEPKATAASLYGPRGVAIAPDGAVWVSDTGNNRIVRYSRLLTEPFFVGKKGTGPGEFSGPVGIAVGPSGSVYVADVGNRRIELFDSGGKFLSSLPVPGWAAWCEAHLELDVDETLYVADPLKNTVFRLDRKGSLVKTWTADDAGKAFSRPTGIAIDRQRRMLYVINSGDNSVSALKLLEGSRP